MPEKRTYFVKQPARNLAPANRTNFSEGNSERTRLTYNCAHLRSIKESLTIWVKFFGVKIFLGEGGEGSEGIEGGDWVRCPPSDLDCMRHQDSENIAHC